MAHEQKIDTDEQRRRDDRRGGSEAGEVAHLVDKEPGKGPGDFTTYPEAAEQRDPSPTEKTDTKIGPGP